MTEIRTCLCGQVLQDEFELQTNRCRPCIEQSKHFEQDTFKENFESWRF